MVNDVNIDVHYEDVEHEDNIDLDSGHEKNTYLDSVHDDDIDLDSDTEDGIDLEDVHEDGTSHFEQDDSNNDLFIASAIFIFIKVTKGVSNVCLQLFMNTFMVKNTFIFTFLASNMLIL